MIRENPYFDQNILKDAKQNYQRISIEEDTLGELDELPAVKLCEGDAELWSFKELQIFNVFAVQNFDVDDLVKYFGKLNSEIL